MKLTWSAATLTLREPFRTSRGTITRRDAVEVVIEQDGVRGHGEVVTSRYYQLDLAVIDTVLTEVSTMVADYPGPRELRADLGSLRERFASRLGVICAVDVAVHDLLARLAGCPVHTLLGLPTWRPRPTARTIGLTTPRQAHQYAADLVAAGFSVLKVKLGQSTSDTLAVAAAVRAAAPQATLLIDPNGAWTAEQAVHQLDSLSTLDIAVVEQPVPAGRIEDLAWVAARSRVPVIADEDARTAADVAALAGGVHGVNIKLVECGGLDGALAMVAAARVAGLSVMLGCLASSSLSIAPAVHLAPLARWLDLDGHLLLADDPWTGIGGEGGELTLEPTPGLGVRRTP